MWIFTVRQECADAGYVIGLELPPSLLPMRRRGLWELGSVEELELVGMDVRSGDALYRVVSASVHLKVPECLLLQAADVVIQGSGDPGIRGAVDQTFNAVSLQHVARDPGCPHACVREPLWEERVARPDQPVGVPVQLLPWEVPRVDPSPELELCVAVRVQSSGDDKVRLAAPVDVPVIVVPQHGHTCRWIERIGVGAMPGARTVGLRVNPLGQLLAELVHEHAV
mmetsp:Transcript_118032/g.328980  ORF Transcript_118032/g.328980 Transcript_118032/m.328980 type:complete len:225 (-) Transcript_118032:376-1050(-)